MENNAKLVAKLWANKFSSTLCISVALSLVFYVLFIVGIIITGKSISWLKMFFSFVVIYGILTGTIAGILSFIIPSNKKYVYATITISSVYILFITVGILK